MTTHPGTRIEILGALDERCEEILTPDVLRLLAALHDKFGERRLAALERGRARRERIEAGADPRFLVETTAIREASEWRVAAPAPGLTRRIVEIVGPTDRRTVQAMLASGADVWVADHEDGLSPTWSNIVEGQLNLADAIRGRIPMPVHSRRSRPEITGAPTIMFRPRGWHLTEQNLRCIDREGRARSASASLVDFGLYAFHNARELVARGSGPYFYLPKIESHLDARLWDDVFTFTENALGLTHGTIRATVQIETITAAFEMEEILFELKDHSAGLNLGRWDYLFSLIKHYRARGRAWILPDRSEVTMSVPFMRGCSELLVSTCHRRGAHAIGAMTSYVPDRRQRPEVTSLALKQVAAEDRAEALDGYDGTWVAHPDLVALARREFEAVMGSRDHQLDRLRDDVVVTEHDLLDIRMEGTVITADGIHHNVTVAMRYLDAWLRGEGSVVIDGIIEDMAAAEISRSQLSQWIHQGAITTDGLPVTKERVEWVIDRTLMTLPRVDGDRLDDAAELLKELVLGEPFRAFMSVPAYARHLRTSAPALVAHVA